MNSYDVQSAKKEEKYGNIVKSCKKGNIVLNYNRLTKIRKAIESK